MKHFYVVPVTALPPQAAGGLRLLVGVQTTTIAQRPGARDSGALHYSWSWRDWPPDPTLALVTVEWEAMDGPAQAAWEALPVVVSLPPTWEWATAVVPAALATKGPVPATFGAFVKQLPRHLHWHLREP